MVKELSVSDHLIVQEKPEVQIYENLPDFKMLAIFL
jgi:hypothetical protein